METLICGGPYRGLPVQKCPGCGCELSDYEVFACRLRGLKRPVCIGCMAGALVFVKKGLIPMLHALQQAVLDLAERTGGEAVDSMWPKARTTECLGRGASTIPQTYSESRLKIGKRPLSQASGTPPKNISCPECGSARTWKDGLRYPRSNNDPVQRWICRKCGFRFSEPSSAPQTVDRQVLNSPVAKGSARRVASLMERW